jgi:FkbM family methyltransferase
MIVVDGGAHIGLYSLLASRRIGDTGEVIAFEPDPYNFHVLAFNLKQNHCSNVLPTPKALSNNVGSSIFFQNSGTISSSLVERRDFGSCKRIQVEVTRLDEELQSVKIDSILIKLDLEGHELLALQGMKDVLQRGKSVNLFCEVNPTALTSAGFTPQDIVYDLKNLGFELYFIDEMRNKLLRVERQTKLEKGNLYCFRKY